MYNKILLAADGSKHSLRAAEKAIGLVKKNQGVIDIVYVVSGTDSKADVLHYSSKEEIRIRRKEKLAELEALLQKEAATYDIHILHGEPGPTVVDFANNNPYDCVVIGSRGLNQVQSLVLGSVSHKVAKRVESPVLIVK
ncbi:universal stress protein [Bacillus suaedae]|uniref:Universal stress protein n=1 Tax=Halalkalibacter suaedae TaxID=2822140 RepID=A0A940WW79_9BACI|nr:universal stress protein [Bacillus suaedae]MBP3952838.1 universal stress protein [Bacillus suaedae]